MSFSFSIASLRKYFETKKKNLVSLFNDAPIDSDLKPIKVGKKNSILELSETEFKVRGTIDADAITVNGSSVQTGTDAGATQLNELSDVSYTDGDLTISSLDKIITSGDLTFEIGGDVQANLSGGDWRWFYQAVGGPFEMVSIGYESAVGCYFKMAHILDPDDDYFKIVHSASNRQTTISTDSDDAGGNTSHLNFDIKGNIIFDPASGYVAFSKDGTQFIQLDMNTSSTAKFQTESNYHLQFESQGTGDMTFDSGGDIILDSHDGNFIAKKAGTEFSSANSAYAGMILGYTALGIDDADTEYSITASFATVDVKAKVTFVAPPSGNVEIFASAYLVSTATRQTYFGLSDNETYNTVDATHEHEVWQGDETDENTFNHQWVLTGLTAGSSYTYWLGAKSAQSGRIKMRWGGNTTGEYAPLIMKATALPATIYTGT